MYHIRTSVPQDIPAIRELWALAFGDGGDYLDNFFCTYYRPERMIVLEEAGVLHAMTAWFDTTFRLTKGEDHRAAYLYAVATHPNCRGKGLAGQLLAWADNYFRSLGIPAVTTVPAEPSLHNFFGANGFRECFVTHETSLTAEQLPSPSAPLFRPVSAVQYGALREQLLAHIPHIVYPEEALIYQEGCCAMGGLHLCAADTAAGPVLLCPERADDSLVICKEFLGSPDARAIALSDLPRTAPATRWLVRGPMPSNKTDGWKFAMLKWLDSDRQNSWNWGSTAYLGLAFD